MQQLLCKRVDMFEVHERIICYITPILSCMDINVTTFGIDLECPSVMGISNNFWILKRFYSNNFFQKKQVTDYSPLFETTSIPENFHVHTKTCRIPVTEIKPEYYRRNWRVDVVPNCSQELLFTDLTQDDSVLSLKKEYRDTKLPCSIYSINSEGYATPFSDLKKPQNVAHLDRFMAKCGSHKNFYRTLPISPEIQTKLNFWKNHSTSKAWNVLFIGFDTVSRSHLHRSLPKTLEFLSKKGFVDLKGYHSLAPYTTVNTAAMLMGLQTCLDCPQVYNDKCAKTINDYLDECPVIIKDFNAGNFLTLYMDNAENEYSPLQLEMPIADFHVNPIFHVVNKFREKRNIEKRECFSNESGVEFMISYQKKFMEKFKNYPFFAFTWFAHPFHDYPYSLAHYDIKFLNFFQSLDPKIYSRTLIMISGDHGERYQFFNSDGVEGYIERSLPPLLVRLPDHLPNFAEATSTLNQNADKLTSAFDIHQTFRHILNYEVPGEAFALKDRSSLMKSIPDDRTCDKLHVLKGFCVCNATENRRSLENSIYLKELIIFSIDQLNQMVQSSEIGEFCEEWITVFMPEIAAFEVSRRSETKIVLLRFFARPKSTWVKHKFEIRLSVSHKYNSISDKMSLVPGSIMRVDAYGQENSCIFETNIEDKLVKELCFSSLQTSNSSSTTLNCEFKPGKIMEVVVSTGGLIPALVSVSVLTLTVLVTKPKSFSKLRTILYEIRKFVEDLILFLITASWILALGVPYGVLMVWRATIWLYLKIRYGFLGELVSAPDVIGVMDTDRSRQILKSLKVMEGDCDLDDLRVRCQLAVGRVDSKTGHLVYPKFYQILDRVGGFFCWKPSNYDIEHHVRFLDGLDENSPSISEAEAMERCGRVCNEAFAPGRAHWEILVIPKFHYDVENEDVENAVRKLAIYVRIHHGIGDGFSLLKFILKDMAREKECDIPLPKKPKRSVWFGIGVVLFFMFRGPRYLYWEMIHKDENPLMKLQASGQKCLAWSEQISVEFVKEIKSKLKTGMSTVMLSAFAGAVRRYYDEIDNGQHPKQVSLVMPLPAPNHPDDQMVNKFSIILFPLAIDSVDPVERVRDIDREGRKLAQSPEVVMNLFLVTLAGAMPVVLARPFFTNTQATMVVSNIPGPSRTIKIYNRKLVDTMFWLPHLGSSGISISFLSYGSNLRIGLTVDKGIIPNGNDGARGILQNTIEELVKLAEQIGVSTEGVVHDPHASHTFRSKKSSDADQPSNDSSKSLSLEIKASEMDRDEIKDESSKNPSQLQNAILSGHKNFSRTASRQ
ncbi:unnamed protein product [Allacma fusca]|uniref:O-acyltransferase WSD1 C-terminal domain-containing protein n=1 Tax=Allacma fusca TaxID=39272 RepID=A0A8J2JP98_9HEXA|nr:unnamed protein product [Allacma fusca]